MTHLIKFMKRSLSFAPKAIDCCTNGILTPKNRLKCIIAKTCEKSQQRCMTTTTYCNGKYGNSCNSNKCKCSILLGTSFAFLGFFEKKEEEKENPLITTIKRSILLIQKGEYKTAEQMLHVALRQAQSLQNEDGITYVYDVMANLAFQVGDFDKAEKLFKSVMQRELAKGTPKDDVKIVHMSLKMAKILEQKGDYENAELGFEYCLKILQDFIDKGIEDIDIITLWAMNLDWYAHLLLSMSKFNEAMKYMENAYELCVKLNGELHEQSIVLLNDLGTISFLKGNLDEAVTYLNKAADLGEKIPNMEDLASIHINLGSIYIKQGLLEEAKNACSKGWKLSKENKNQETLSEAKTCLDEVNKLLT